MKKMLGMMGLALLAGILLISPAGADSGIEVLSNEAEPSFAENIRFYLSAQSSKPIADVVLFYRETLEAATNRAYPEFTPGRQIEAEYTWDLLPGEVPVGAEVKYYWILTDEEGQEFKTEPQVVRYDDTRFNWRIETAEDILFHWYGGDEQRAKTLLQTAKAALDRISTDIGVKPKHRIKIYVYNSKEDMRPALVSRSESYDARTTTLGVVIAEDTLLLLGSAMGVEQTVAHELTHVVVGQATDNPFHAPIPRWLDEGLAMYNEGQLPYYNQQALEDAIANDTLISVRSLSSYTGDPSQVDLFYAQSYSIADYLLGTYGKEKMVELLNVFGRGAHQEDALQEVYGFGLDELDARWREWVGARPREQAPVGVPDTV